MTKGKGRIVLLWRIGSLRFKGLWKNYYEKHNQSTTCPHPLCGKTDELNHAMECLFMYSRVNKSIKDKDYRMADYLLKLNKERNKYKAPII